MVGRFSVVMLAAGVMLVAGCRGTATPVTTRIGLATTPTATASESPMPRHVVFAPGETISADEQAGIFFLDPATGQAEGWVVPAETFQGLTLPFRFSVGGFSADGAHVVYTCMESQVDSGPVPCGGAPVNTWYLLDTKSGQRARLGVFTGPFLSISPDGNMLLGATANGFALADAEPAEAPPVIIAPTAGLDVAVTHAEWNADGSRVVLTTSTPPASGSSVATLLVNTSSGRVTTLDSGASWSPDGARLLSGTRVSDDKGELRMLDRDGRLLWSKSSTGASVWSADGSLLYGQVLDEPQPSDAYGPFDRLDIIDSSTGATKYRVRGGICALGWVAETHSLIIDSYGFGQALVDLDAGSVRRIDAYARPTPFDPNMAILFDDSGFRSYDLATGATKLIAHATVAPAWDPNHGALFAGNRLVFTALHLGHGGCGEGASPQNPPRPELLVGPFADDAPVMHAPDVRVPERACEIRPVSGCMSDGASAGVVR